MVHTAGPGEPYYVQLVGPDGNGGPWATATTRSEKTLFAKEPCMAGPDCDDMMTAPYWIPETSASRTRVYFLDGETRIMALGLDGRVSTITDVPAPPNSQVIFSVSPDDSRLAVSIVTLATSFSSPGPFDDVMYVEDLLDGANHVQLYRSTEFAEWPIGWKDRSLVVAMGTHDLAFHDNPYGALGYQLVDPVNGHVRATLDCNQGLVVSAGTACSSGLCPIPTYCEVGQLAVQSWDGAKVDFALPAEARRVFVPYTYLSPAGDQMAVAIVTDVSTGKLKTAVLAGGAIRFTSLAGTPQGWLDETHLVLSTADTVSIVDIASGVLVEVTDLKAIPQQGQPHLVGTLPPSL
jgi:hypothetical protein